MIRGRHDNQSCILLHWHQSVLGVSLWQFRHTKYARAKLCLRPIVEKTADRVLVQKTQKLIGDLMISEHVCHKRSIPWYPHDHCFSTQSCWWCYAINPGDRRATRNAWDTTAPICTRCFTPKKPLDESYLIVLTLLIPIRINSNSIHENRINIVIQVPKNPILTLI